MARGEQRRPVASRTFYRRPNQACDPVDQKSGIPTCPDYLVQQGPTGFFGTEGLWVDGRPVAGSYDQPGFTGDLPQPVIGDW